MGRGGQRATACAKGAQSVEEIDGNQAFCNKEQNDNPSSKARVGATHRLFLGLRESHCADRLNMEMDPIACVQCERLEIINVSIMSGTVECNSDLLTISQDFGVAW